MTNRTIVLSVIIQIFVLPALAAPVEVTPTAKCRVVERHIPDADVAHRPGGDAVAGKPVVPADLDGGGVPITVPQNFEIEIDAPLGQGDPANRDMQDQRLYQPRAKIGRVQVRDLEGDTALDFNGQPLYRAAPGVAAPECATNAPATSSPR